VLDLTSLWAKNVLSGSASVVLNKNGIDDHELKKNNLDVSDLVESLRGEGYFALEGIEYALYESEGTFSALPKKNYQEMQTSLPVIVIDEGKFDEKNLEQTKRGKQYFLEILKQRGCKDIKQILIMTVDGNGKVYLQRKGKKYEVFSLGWETSLW
jgi:uncharacterized membrane protein YcaP (DUF421 family)